MKTWVLLPLVVFIAIAGYQFGYYHAKLDFSDADKKRISTVVGDSQTITTDVDSMDGGLQAAELPADMGLKKARATAPVPNPEPVVPEPAEAERSAANTVAQLQQANEDEALREHEQQVFIEDYQDQDLDMQAATEITDFLQLHPQGHKLYLHTVRCNQAQCQLIGEFNGTHEDFSAMLNEMKTQAWWQYGGTSSNTTSDGHITHFVLHLTDKDQHS